MIQPGEQVTVTMASRQLCRPATPVVVVVVVLMDGYGGVTRVATPPQWMVVVLAAMALSSACVRRVSGDRHVRTRNPRRLSLFFLCVRACVRV